MKIEEYNHKTYNPLLKILFFLLIVGFTTVIFSLFGLFISSKIFGIPFDGASSIPALMQNIDAMILMQIVSAIGMFVVPVFVYANTFEKNALSFLKLNKAPTLKAILFTIAIFFMANFVLDLLVKLMYLIPFENFDSEWIKTMLQAETENENTLKKFLDFKSPMKFIAVFFMMAVLPALGEELTFRGVFMNLVEENSKNYIIAILISAFVFAVIHVQLHNFLAIFFMGMVLGYVYYLTKNLWVSIVAHLFNNGLIVVMSYLNNIGVLTFDFTEKDDMPLIVSIFGAILFFVVFHFYKKFILNENSING